MSPVTAARNRMLSMEIESSLELALFRSWLTDITFHTHMSMGIMQKPSF